MDKYKLNLQLFAEGEAGAETAQSQTEAIAEEVKTYDEAYVKQLRAEAAKYRTKHKELEKTSKTQQSDFQLSVLKALGLNPDPNKNYESQISELNTKVQEAEKRANEKLVKAEIKSLSATLGIVDPDAAYQLIDKSGLKVEDSGDVKGVKEALEALLKAKPYLKKTGITTIGGGTNPAGAGGKVSSSNTMNEFIRRSLRR